MHHILMMKVRKSLDPPPSQPEFVANDHVFIGMDMLEKNKTKHVVVPALNWLIGTLYDAEKFGYPRAKAEEVGYKKELETAILGLREMHRRGIVVLPGGYFHSKASPAQNPPVLIS